VPTATNHGRGAGRGSCRGSRATRSAWSAPSGTTAIFAGSTRQRATMSDRVVTLGTITRRARATTRCIRSRTRSWNPSSWKERDTSKARSWIVTTSGARQPCT